MFVIGHINFIGRFFRTLEFDHTKYWGTLRCLMQPYIFLDFVLEREFLITQLKYKRHCHMDPAVFRYELIFGCMFLCAHSIKWPPTRSGSHFQ